MQQKGGRPLLPSVGSSANASLTNCLVRGSPTDAMFFPCVGRIWLVEKLTFSDQTRSLPYLADSKKITREHLSMSSSGKANQSGTNQASKTINRLQKKLKGIDVCPHCGEGLPRIGLNACMHCKKPLIWYMDVVGKPGQESLCRNEYKAKLHVKHPELANATLLNGKLPWLIGSTLALLALLSAWNFLAS